MSDSQIDTIAEIAKKVSAENNRRFRMEETINELLTERQEVLVAMCELAEMESKDVDAEAVIEYLKTFSQTLVDYTALGHFEIYERIIDGKERRVKVNRVADQVYPSISTTTEYIVEFNDKYDGADDLESLTNLYKDLSFIGEAIAQRIESEDKLLNEMTS
ncbi:MAG: Rsd/AlgQ family anti-sigma factor [Gammaproteobacteria bacterium]|nr:MAG: Rsd/AlgQ family anti-sigma factor [Gammaproteobacteria bacterium]